MKVLLVSNYVPDRQHSMLGFASCLERELPKLGCEVTRISPRPIFGTRGRRPGIRKWLAYVDKYVVFPGTLRRAAKRHDITHILDQGNSMYVAHVSARPHLVTCHDLLAIRAALGELPEWEVSGTGRRYQAMILRGLRQARFVAADSKATADDLERIAGIPSERIKLIYIGPVQDMPRLADGDIDGHLQAAGITGPYFLHVGNASPYKNRKGLIPIYSRLLDIRGESCPDLVLAGADLKDAVKELLSDLPHHKVHLVTNPSFETLSALYHRAEALIFPSLYEGFGLPILEAQSSGCPVFTTNRAPMTEVGGAAARYFDPTDPVAAANTIDESLAHAEDMRAAGYENLARFSPQAMATAYVQLYRELASARTSQAVSAEFAGATSSLAGDGSPRRQP